MHVRDGARPLREPLESRAALLAGCLLRSGGARRVASHGRRPSPPRPPPPVAGDRGGDRGGRRRGREGGVAPRCVGENRDAPSLGVCQSAIPPRAFPRRRVRRFLAASSHPPCGGRYRRAGPAALESFDLQRETAGGHGGSAHSLLAPPPPGRLRRGALAPSGGHHRRAPRGPWGPWGGERCRVVGAAAPRHGGWDGRDSAAGAAGGAPRAPGGPCEGARAPPPRARARTGGGGGGAGELRGAAPARRHHRRRRCLDVHAEPRSD
mmetsp:Transcript_67604/g.161768  ORF Transcript_67604/g.161768 Transcript_67604/m.161768 type:complete len:265 (-) Transcript_67604:796-1590(-)